MQCTIVQAHPNSDSLCAAAVGRVKAQHSDHALIDLYADEFNPVLSQVEMQRRFPWDPLTQRYIHTIENSELVYFVYPEWWGGPPAILKGFLDRVLRPEVAYRFSGQPGGAKKVLPMWQDKTFQVIVTSDSAEQDTGQRARAMWTAVGDFCGARLADPAVFGPVYTSTARQRTRFLQSLESLHPAQMT